MPETERQPNERQVRRPEPRHPWSLQIARVAGIPIRIHFTFFLLLIWVAVKGAGGRGAIEAVAYVMVAFACVVLHELGHSLVAMRYGIDVSDITLYPIGGIARIMKRPTPKQEFWIALAGPAVNVVIAIALWLLLGMPSTEGAFQAIARSRSAWPMFVLNLTALNVVLVAFNMIPAFPMDGGRVFRSVLAMYFPPERATAIAAGIGQLLAILAGIGGMMLGNVMLMFIALFVFIGASQEANAYQQASAFAGVTVRQAMMTDFRTLPMNATLKEAADVLLSTAQHEFPVMLGEAVQGLLTRNGLLKGLAEQGAGAYVAAVMDRGYNAAAPEDELANALTKIKEGSEAVLVLENNERLLGMLTGDNLAEFLAIRQIFRAQADPRSSQS